MSVRTTSCAWSRERIVSPTLLLLLVATAIVLPRFSEPGQAMVFGSGETQPLRTLGPSSWTIRSGIEDRLILAGTNGNEQAPAVDSPVRLGSLQPKGRVAADGSEIWGYPEGSGLEEVIEVHVKNGRVVREVLRPSAISSVHSMADELSPEEAPSSSTSGR
jgi:hypothetical protein